MRSTSNEIFLVFVDVTILTTHGCGHCSVPIIRFTSLGNSIDTDALSKLYISDTIKVRIMIFTGMEGLDVGGIID